MPLRNHVKNSLLYFFFFFTHLYEKKSTCNWRGAVGQADAKFPEYFFFHSQPRFFRGSLHQRLQIHTASTENGAYIHSSMESLLCKNRRLICFLCVYVHPMTVRWCPNDSQDTNSYKVLHGVAHRLDIHFDSINTQTYYQYITAKLRFNWRWTVSQACIVSQRKKIQKFHIKPHTFGNTIRVYI